ncbi:DUF1559 family PulG-like putative transporter [Lignipirellula cremea]|uniref:DUF1559 domain-containing protein n=1 Tax=Lignipirellula cremea TaxID=2528010 RepID=A0A518DU15_9BACT|nr:DUF1559 domain-containing protein [Lignipirellula cremea]QDU95330.1 hypothetical protein Pla8534_31450 [Lignipirellula cremea]
MEFTCSYCGHRGSASDDRAGQTRPCENCGGTVTLPAARSTYASGGPAPGQPPGRRSGGKLASCLLIAVLGLVGCFCCCGVGAVFLPRMLEPAIEAAREAGVESVESTACRNQLKQIGLALASYYDQHDEFPPAFYTDENGQPMHSWRVLLLPHLDKSPLYAQYDFDEPWDGPNNRRLMEHCPEVFRCPADQGDQNASSYQVVVGPGTGWQANKGPSMQEIPDGLSRTISVIEVHGKERNWLDPAALKLEDVLPPAEKMPGPTVDQDDPHGGVRHTVFFDGSVHDLPVDLSPATLRQLLETKDGEPVDMDF